MGSTSDFPRYQMVIDGQRRYCSLAEAARAYDSGHVPVEFGETVMEADLTERPMMLIDRQLISDRADELSAAK